MIPGDRVMIVASTDNCVPEDIAGAALFLASDLSDFVTGIALDINGGELMY